MPQEFTPAQFVRTAAGIFGLEHMSPRRQLKRLIEIQPQLAAPNEHSLSPVYWRLAHDNGLSIEMMPKGDHKKVTFILYVPSEDTIGHDHYAIDKDFLKDYDTEQRALIQQHLSALYLELHKLQSVRAVAHSSYPMSYLDLATDVLHLVDIVSTKGTPDENGNLHLGEFNGGRLTLQIDNTRKPTHLVMPNLAVSHGTIRHLSPKILMKLRETLKEAAMAPHN